MPKPAAPKEARPQKSKGIEALALVARAAAAGQHPEALAVLIDAGFVAHDLATLADVAAFFGVTEAKCKGWTKQPGWPCNKPGRGKAGAYNVAAIARWREATAADLDPLYAGPSSPELERLRRVTREIKELERDERAGRLVERDAMRSLLAMIAKPLRTATEQLQQRFGADAHRLIAEALANFEQLCAEQLPEIKYPG